MGICNVNFQLKHVKGPLKIDIIEFAVCGDDHGLKRCISVIQGIIGC